MIQLWDKKQELTSGIFAEIPEPSYRKNKGLSQSELKIIDKKTTNFVSKSKRPKFFLERAAHCVILEPHKFDDQFQVCPSAFKGSKAAAWKKQVRYNNPNMGVLDYADYKKLQRMRAKFDEHPLAPHLVSGGYAELSMFWDEHLTCPLCNGEGCAPCNFTGVIVIPCKARPDYVIRKGNQIIIVDYKTCQDASEEEFSRTISKYKYHLQAAWYIRAVRRLLKSDIQHFIFIAQEKEIVPFDLAVYPLEQFDKFGVEIEDNDVIMGGKLADKILDKYAKCLLTNEWTAYPTGMCPIRRPRYHYGRCI